MKEVIALTGSDVAEERLEIHEAAVEKTAVETRGAQTLGMVGVPAFPAIGVGEIAAGVEAHDRRVPVRAVIQVATVESRADRQLVADRPGIEALPGAGIAEVALGVEAHGNAGIERHQIYVATVKGRAVETGALRTEKFADIDAGAAGRIGEIGLRIQTQHPSAVFVFAVGIAGEARAEVDIAAIESRALLRVRLARVVHRPVRIVVEGAVRVVAQDPAVVVDHVDLPRHEIRVATVEYRAVKAPRVDPAGAPGVVGGIALAVVEGSVRIVAQHDTVRRLALLAVLLGHEVDVATVAYRAEVTPRRQSVQVSGIEGTETRPDVRRRPLRHQRLQALAPRGAGIDPCLRAKRRSSAEIEPGDKRLVPRAPIER